LADRLAIPEAERAAFLLAARPVRGGDPLGGDRQPVARPEEEASDDPFVGRANELGLLRALLARLTAGSGHAVLVEGEPGIGKSRLMGELSRYARENHCPTLAARCYEIERAMPYQPIADLVTQALETASDASLRRLARVSLSEIAALVPSLAQRVAVAALSSDFPEARQSRLFRAISEFFEAVTEGRQLVVVVDDIQWADDASAQFLHFLARQAASRALLVLLAYRDEEVAIDERLAGLIASLRRESHVRHVPLARLRLAETEALA